MQQAQETMVTTLIVSEDPGFFKGLEPEFKAAQITWQHTSTGRKALEKMPTDLLVLDENLPDMDARTFIESVITRSPMTHCVIASPRSEKSFHDYYEGFGVLMQFPAWPGSDQAEKLISRLEKIHHLQTQVNKEQGKASQ